MDDSRLLNEYEIYYLCKIILEEKRDISVGKTIMRFARLEEDAALFRKIHSQLLESGRYVESSETDKYGLKRLRYAPKKPPKERFWLLIAFLGWLIGIFTNIAVAKLQLKFQEPTKEQTNQKLLTKKDSLSKHR